MFIGRGKGFGQRFDLSQPSPCLAQLHPLCGDCDDDDTRSRVTLSLIRDEIKENRINEKLVRPEDPLLDEAVRRAFRAFKLPERQLLLHLNEVFQQDLPIWSSSPGLPWIHYGYKTKGDIRRDPEAIQRVRHFWYRIKRGQNIDMPDCCAYVCSNLCKMGEAIWVYPATVTFGEAVFAIPLIRAYQKYRMPIAYGYETGIDGMRKIFQEFKGGTHFLRIDFSKFEKSLPSWLLEIAFDILECNLDFTKYQDHGVPLASAMIRMWDAVKDYFINTKIRMCNGEQYMKRSGLAIGSYFTDLVDRLCKYILLTYAALKFGVTIENLLVFVEGDSIMATFEVFTPDQVQEALGPLGLTINVAKSGYSKYISNLLSTRI